MSVVADRAFTSRSTLQRIEAGDPGVGIGIYAAVLQSWGFWTNSQCRRPEPRQRGTGPRIGGASQAGPSAADGKVRCLTSRSTSIWPARRIWLVYCAATWRDGLKRLRSNTIQNGLRQRRFSLEPALTLTRGFPSAARPSRLRIDRRFAPDTWGRRSCSAPSDVRPNEPGEPSAL